GLDDIDLALTPALGVDRSQIRARRERLPLATLRQHEGVTRAPCQRIRRHYQSCFEQAKAKDPRPNTFLDSSGLIKHQLFLIGGGAKCEPVVDATCRLAEGWKWRANPEALEVPPGVIGIDSKGVRHSCD